MADLLRNGWWIAFGKRKRRGKGRKVGPPVHDDLVKRDFTAAGPNRLWLADITEHRTAEGKLYLCAVKDVWSNRIVGYSIDSRMKSRLAVAALHNAVAAAPAWPGACCTRTGGRNFVAGNSSGPCTITAWSGRWDESGRPVITP